MIDFSEPFWQPGDIEIILVSLNYDEHGISLDARGGPEVTYYTCACCQASIEDTDLPYYGNGVPMEHIALMIDHESGCNIKRYIQIKEYLKAKVQS
jgi:hypothetical protein